MAPKVLKATKGSRSGANDGKKGSKAAGIGAVVEGGAMATAVLQRKAVGSLSGGVEAQVRTLLRVSPSPVRASSPFYRNSSRSRSLRRWRNACICMQISLRRAASVQSAHACVDACCLAGLPPALLLLHTHTHTHTHTHSLCC